MNTVFIGWDAKEVLAYDVLEYSIKKHQSEYVDIIPLKKDSLQVRGLYWRNPNEAASTDFAYTRFLIPHLMDYKGWALFMDCDMLVTQDINSLFNVSAHAGYDEYAILCTQHDYSPKNKMKMDGQKQVAYPRKNWSSFMLINCGHPANKSLTPQYVNSSLPKNLHRFEWLDDRLIGSLDLSWNFLVGEQEATESLPANIHYTLGMPFMQNYWNCDYSMTWYRYARAAGVWGHPHYLEKTDMGQH